MRKGEGVGQGGPRQERAQASRIPIHVDGVSLGLSKDELAECPPAQTPDIERKLIGEVTPGRISRAVTGAIDSLSALPRTIRALGRNRDYIVKPSTGDVIERPDTYNSGSEKLQAEERAGRKTDAILPGRVARAKAMIVEPIDGEPRADFREKKAKVQPVPKPGRGLRLALDAFEGELNSVTTTETLAEIFPGYEVSDFRRIDSDEPRPVSDIDGDPEIRELTAEADFEQLSQPKGVTGGTIWSDERYAPEEAEDLEMEPWDEAMAAEQND